jgi:hypothetical protein
MDFASSAAFGISFPAAGSTQKSSKKTWKGFSMWLRALIEGDETAGTLDSVVCEEGKSLGIEIVGLLVTSSSPASCCRRIVSIIETSITSTSVAVEDRDGGSTVMASKVCEHATEPSLAAADKKHISRMG